MDTKLEPQFRPITKQFDMIDFDHTVPAIRATAGTAHFHQEPQTILGRRTFADMPDERLEFAAILGVDRIIRIHPEDPLAACMPDRLIPRSPQSHHTTESETLARPGSPQAPVSHRSNPYPRPQCHRQTIVHSRVP